jgi:hypothetical protein
MLQKMRLIIMACLLLGAMPLVQAMKVYEIVSEGGDNLEGLKRALSSGGNVDDYQMFDYNKSTALQQAIQKKNFGCAQYLVEQGAAFEPNEIAYTAQNPYSEGRFNVVKAMLEKVKGMGKDVQKKYITDDLICRATSSGSPEVVNLVLGYFPKNEWWGTSYSSSPLMSVMLASITGDQAKAVVQALVEQAKKDGEKDNFLKIVYTVGKVGDEVIPDQTALAWSIDKQQDKAAVYLIEQGAPPAADMMDAPTAWTTALFDAAVMGLEKTIEAILPKISGADIKTITDAMGKTLLHYAAQKGHDKLVTYLLSKGADANLKDKDGKTPLTLAQELLVSKKTLHRGEVTVEAFTDFIEQPKKLQQAMEDFSKSLHTLKYSLGQGKKISEEKKVKKEWEKDPVTGEMREKKKK